MSRVGVIGQGYVGLALAAEAANSGHIVVGYDIDSHLISELKQGISRIEDVPGSTLVKLIKSNRYLPTNEGSSLNSCEIVIIAVPTPLTKDQKPDLNFLQAAVETISKFIKSEILIINESTSYPGTLRKFIAENIFNKSGIKHKYAAAPERIDPGNKNWTIYNTTRIVSGLDHTATREAVNFYLTFTNSVVTVSTPEVAEMSKLVENSFRQVNIAFVNELAQIANVFGVSIHEVLQAANTKPHGFMKFTPGAGVGGHCIPIDPIYLSFESKRKGIESSLIDRANIVNQSMPSYIVSRILADHSNNLKDKRIVVIGVAYKSNVADIRESPAFDIIKLLLKANAKVVWHDPVVKNILDQDSQEIDNQDIAVVITLHDSIKIEKLKKIKYVFDCTGNLTWATNL